MIPTITIITIAAHTIAIIKNNIISIAIIAHTNMRTTTTTVIIPNARITRTITTIIFIVIIILPLLLLSLLYHSHDHCHHHYTDSIAATALSIPRRTGYSALALRPHKQSNRGCRGHRATSESLGDAAPLRDSPEWCILLC